MIQLKNVCAGYEGKEVLHNICVNFPEGKITAIVGPNGCGKSTLIKSLVRINPHTSGEIFVKNKNIKDYSSKELAQQIAYVAQNKQIPDISVLKMVLHGRFPYLSYPRRYGKEDLEIARQALDWAGLSDLENELVSHLSGGMQQKVYIAMALAQDSQAILMDEPTTYLDISHQLRLMEMIKQLAEKGKTVVLVLHDLSQAFRIADEVIVLKEGSALSAGTPLQVFESGKLEEAFGVTIERVETKSGWHYISQL
ncbi:MAG: ABC transporter ATP-binding protein [Agathobacter sp.]|nr:ABC transporter ATP-binding protein [Agathobacter sp.]